MFQIKKHQMQALDSQAAAQQDAQMVQAIGVALPDLLPTLAPDQRRQQLAEWVDLGCERAVGMGVTEPDDMAVVVTLQLVRTLLSAAEQEQLRQWASAPLQRDGSSGRVKVALVEFTLQRLAASEALARRLQTIIAQVRAAYH